MEQGYCGKCKRSFSNRLTHVASFPNCKLYNTKCNICNFFFRGTKGLSIHKSLKHNFIFDLRSINSIQGSTDPCLDNSAQSDQNVAPTNVPTVVLTNAPTITPSDDNTNDNNGGGDGGDDDDDGGDGDGNNGINVIPNIPDSKVQKCNRSRCLTCPILDTNEQVTSPITNRTSNFVNYEGNICYCYTSNVVYMLSCNNCDLQYVGQTGRSLKKRVNQHRAAIRLAKKGHCPTWLSISTRGHVLMWSSLYIYSRNWKGVVLPTGMGWMPAKYLIELQKRRSGCSNLGRFSRMALIWTMDVISKLGIKSSVHCFHVLIHNLTTIGTQTRIGTIAITLLTYTNSLAL